MNRTRYFIGAMLMLWAVGGQAAAAPHPTPLHSAPTPNTSPKAMQTYFHQVTRLTFQFDALIGRYSRYQYQGPYDQEEFIPAKDRKNLTLSQEGQSFLQTSSDYLLKAAQITAALAAVRVPPECRTAHAGMLNYMSGLVGRMRGSYDSMRPRLFKDTKGTPALVPEPVQAQKQNQKSRQLLAQVEAAANSLDSGASDSPDVAYRRLEVVRKRYHLSESYGCQLNDPPLYFP